MTNKNKHQKNAWIFWTLQHNLAFAALLPLFQLHTVKELSGECRFQDALEEVFSRIPTADVLANSDKRFTLIEVVKLCERSFSP